VSWPPTLQLRWYRPDPQTLGYLIVARILEIRIGRAQVVLYWYYR
jgi:hypothetical protein